jgi:hypothetical protein
MKLYDRIQRLFINTVFEIHKLKDGDNIDYVMIKHNNDDYIIYLKPVEFTLEFLSQGFNNIDVSRLSDIQYELYLALKEILKPVVDRQEKIKNITED